MPRWDVQVSLNRQRAICSGQETYQGTPCKHGHPGIRYVKWNGKCVDCHKDGRPSYYGENREIIREKYEADPLKYLIRAAKTRAKKRGLEFNLDYSKLELPERCPISGKPMVVGTPDAPSIDRIDNSRGYTMDNIQIISKKINTAKSVLTAEEVRKLADFMTLLS